ncbi:MAG: translation elongation factor Ts [Proteobacteria bacterium]|nr:translation elongation factor Ts [Pseudomonadota bacterium]
MVEITAAWVKELREKTGAGMMDCKKALSETDGEMEAAVDWLRKKGLAAAAKRAGRTATEGLVGVLQDARTGAVVEVNCETDFVARNETFQGAVRAITALGLEARGDLDKLKSAAYPEAGRTVQDQIAHLIATIGENINLRRAACLEVKQGVVASYVHGAVAPGLGRIGVLVALESTGEAAKLEALGHQLAMHIAATSPQAIDVPDVDSAALERERAVLADQARASGKPEEIIQKMVEGRLKKFYEEVVLLEQVYVIDGKTKVRQAVEDAAKEIAAPVKVADYVRFGLGAGVEE